MAEMTIKYWVAWVYGIIGTALISFSAYLFKRFRREQVCHRATELGVQALLRSSIVHIYNKYSALGYIPIYERENLDELYKQYMNLGGNGVIKDLVEKLTALPTSERS